MTEDKSKPGIGHYLGEGIALLFLFILMRWVVILLGSFLYWIWVKLKTRTRRTIFLVAALIVVMVGPYLIEAKEEGYFPFRDKEHWIEVIMKHYGFSREEATKDYYYILKYNKYPPDFWDKQGDNNGDDE